MNTRTCLITLAVAAAFTLRSAQAQDPQYRPDQPGVRDRGTGGGYSPDDPYGYDRVPGYRPGRVVIPVYDRRTRVVSGRVTGTSGAFGRKVKVRLDNGEERSVEAPRDIAVRRYSHPISVHELRRGEAVRVRLARYTTDGTLVATRIEAFEGASLYDRSARDQAAGWEATVRGSVRSIDSRENILRLETDGRRVIVHTDDADIRDDSGRIGLRDLQNGDLVTVSGRRDGDEIFARTVTVR